ncbi:SDR family NAD(P)-dependent oxidoreductase [Kocuria rhizosphaericola]|uniref:SDR family NAD(P)-dependent oxidoreductase n=1 Tax=Kocuria rhizosphaericola TaxID=3376284 RepID=UPI0037A263AB
MTSVVTGAAGGIGSAISRRLAAEGSHVVVCDVDADAAQRLVDELHASGAAAEASVFDLLDPATCAAAVEEVVGRRGGVEVLINNAGINRRGDLLSLSPEDWDLSFSINVDAMFHMCRAVLPAMVRARRGSVVNTASQWGLTPAPGHLAYNVSKAAVVSFTKSLARDCAPHGVRVNAVAPGEIRTPMLEAGLARSGRTVAELDAEVPLGRIGRPEEVAALVAFLASDEVPFICGSIVEITGAQAVA